MKVRCAEPSCRPSSPGLSHEEEIQERVEDEVQEEVEVGEEEENEEEQEDEEQEEQGDMQAPLPEETIRKLTDAEWEWYQRAYSLEARLFIGNLPSNMPDEDFEEVLTILRPFGWCAGRLHTHIHRGLLMPTAFIQFENRKCADNALAAHAANPQMFVVDGRKLRIERARGGRTGRWASHPSSYSTTKAIGGTHAHYQINGQYPPPPPCGMNTAFHPQGQNWGPQPQGYAPVPHFPAPYGYGFWPVYQPELGTCPEWVCPLPGYWTYDEYGNPCYIYR